MECLPSIDYPLGSSLLPLGLTFEIYKAQIHSTTNMLISLKIKKRKKRTNDLNRDFQEKFRWLEGI